MSQVSVRLASPPRHGNRSGGAGRGGGRQQDHTISNPGTSPADSSCHGLRIQSRRSRRKNTIKKTQTAKEESAQTRTRTIPGIFDTLHNMELGLQEVTESSDELPLALPLPSDPELAQALDADEERKTDNEASATSQESQSGSLAIWNGTHTEDQLNEHVIRDGYSSKPKVQQELGTARSSLWPHLKTVSSLSTLSAAFVFALQHRQDRDAVTSASTFKPPPRVTLTDTRKTAWLAELADDAIPLRRLSRTIPHGISGRVLLERCLRNRIPISRAMWLVKCIGANELRAFRRKGVSDATVLENESKWVLEWTNHLERFLAEPVRNRDATYSDYQYALQIAARIFSEGLVDNDHFLDWLHTRVKTASVDDLPYVLLQLQCWLPEVMSNFKHAYWTSSACLSKLQDLSALRKHITIQPLVSRLETVVHILAAHSPLTLLHFASDPQRVMALPQSIRNLSGCAGLVQINNTITSSLWAVSTELQDVVDLINAFDHCLNNCPDRIEEPLLAHLSELRIAPGLVLDTLVMWSVSAFRAGDARIYACVRLLDAMQRAGYETRNDFTRAVGSVSNSRYISTTKLGHLITQAFRLQHFDIGYWLRWLVSTGAADSSAQVSTVHSFILREIPAESLPPGLHSLLIQTQDRRRLSSKASDSAIQVVEIKRKIKDFLRSGHQRLSEPFKISLLALSWSAKLEIGSDLIQAFKQATNQGKPFSSEQHGAFLDIFDVIGTDINLAKFVESAIQNADASLLVKLTEATIRHRLCFSAAGRLDSLRVLLIQHYHSIKALETTNRQVLQNLLVLAQAKPRNKTMEDHMAEEIELYDSRPGIAAQTPLSEDHLATEVDADDGCSLEDLQTLFRNVSSCNDLFDAMGKAIFPSKQCDLDLEHAAVVTKWALDRVFDGRPQDAVASIVNKLSWMYAAKEEVASRFLVYLLVFKIVPLTQFFDYLVVSSLQRASTLVLDTFYLCATVPQGANLPGLESMVISRKARKDFELQVSLAVESQAVLISGVLVNMIREICGSETGKGRLQTLLEGSFITTMMQKLAVEENSHLTSLLARHMLPGMNRELHSVMEGLILRQLDPEEVWDLGPKSFVEIIVHVVDNVDETSLPVFRVCLQLLAKLRADDIPSTGEPRAIVFASALKAASQGNLCWTRLLGALPSALDVADEVRRDSEAALLRRHSPSRSSGRDSVGLVEEMSSETLLDLVRATVHSLPASSTHELAMRLISCFDSLEESSDPVAAVHDTIHLALIYHKAFPPSAPDAASHTRTLLLKSLCRLAPDTSSNAYTGPPLPEATRTLIRATLAYFALDAPAATLASLRPSLTPAQSADATLCFLLGAPTPPSPLLLRSHPPPAYPPLFPSPFYMADPAAPVPVTALPSAATTAALSAPFVRSAWELVPDAGGEEAAIGLRLFGARRVEA